MDVNNAVNSAKSFVNNFTDSSQWVPTTLSAVAQDLTDQLFKNPKIFAEKILREKAVSASITIPMQVLKSDGSATISQTVTIPFYMENNFNVGTLKNSWSDLVNLEFANAFAEMLNVAGTFNGSAQVSMQSEAMSLQTWKGSSFDGFTVNCLFLATNRGINPTKIIQTLAATALPTKLKGDKTAGVGFENVKAGIKGAIGGLASGINTIIDSTGSDDSNRQQFKDMVSNVSTKSQDLIDDMGMVAPLHYGINADNSSGRPYAPAEGTTVTLQVGEYFRATELLVNTIGGIEFSKEIIAPKAHNEKRAGDLYDPTSDANGYGFPLFAKCSINLRPASMMTKEKFEGYFINLHDQGGSVFDTISSTLAKSALQLPS